LLDGALKASTARLMEPIRFTGGTSIAPIPPGVGLSNIFE
jgi:hypothetical protein